MQTAPLTLDHAPPIRPAQVSPRPGLWRYFAWALVWMTAAWAGALVIEWSFAFSYPMFVAPVCGVMWVVLGLSVLVQAVRRGRGASVRLKLLLASVFPCAFLVHPLLMVSELGPPSEDCLMTEFSRHRSEFDELGALLDRLAAPRPEADDADPRPALDPLLSRLHVRAPRPAQPCGVELVRWSSSLFGRTIEEGFLYTPVPPQDFVATPDATGPFSSHRALAPRWFTFRVLH